MALAKIEQATLTEQLFTAHGYACSLALLLRESLYSRKAAPNEPAPNPANITVVTSNIPLFHLRNFPIAFAGRLINIIKTTGQFSWITKKARGMGPAGFGPATNRL